MVTDGIIMMMRCDDETPCAAFVLPPQCVLIINVFINMEVCIRLVLMHIFRY